MSLPKGIEDQFSSDDLANIQRLLNKEPDSVIPSVGMKLWTIDVDVMQRVEFHKRITETISVPEEITEMEEVAKYFGAKFNAELDAIGSDGQIEGTHSHGSQIMLGFISVEPKDEESEELD